MTLFNYDFVLGLIFINVNYNQLLFYNMLHRISKENDAANKSEDYCYANDYSEPDIMNKMTLCKWLWILFW
jgi:hypothetical protein